MNVKPKIAVHQQHACLADDPRKAHSLRAIANQLRLPAGRPRISKWMIGSMTSDTISFGKFSFEPLSIDFGSCGLTVVHPGSTEAKTVRGVGMGAGLGESLFPFNISGELPGIHLPEVRGPLVLGPAGRDSMGPWLFQGWAMAIRVGTGLGVRISDSILLFLDVTGPRLANPTEALLAVASPLGTGILGPQSVKAWTVAAGSSLQVGASVGADAMLYWTTVQQKFPEC